MLEDLGSVDWSTVSHAYGPAVDVPDLIRTIANGTRQEKERAWYELYGNLWHQGTVYEATVFAVPFFVEISTNYAQDGLHEVLDYLSALADGGSYLEVHAELIYSEEERSSTEHKETLALEKNWVEQTRQAVRAGLSTFVSYLRHESELVRSSAANLLICFPEDIDKTRPALIDSFRRGDDSEAARASCILAIAVLSRKDRQDEGLLSDAVEKSEPFAVRALGAIGVAWLSRQRTPQEIKRFLDKLTSSKLDTALRLFTWDTGDAKNYLFGVSEVLKGDDDR